ncbi:unnamed protein product [Debaryomyces fabryi]|nr:unnamed protein product [Debaryomyces fabryi]
MPFICTISLSTDLIFISLSDFNLSRSDSAVDLINGIADMKIKTAMIIEAIGSNPSQLKNFVNIVEITTPTDPNVSAKI